MSCCNSVVCVTGVYTVYVFFRSEAQDEQKTQHGEPGADETHSRQDECKNMHHVLSELRLSLF